MNYVLNDPEPGEFYFGNNFFSRNSALYRYVIYRVKKGLIKRERKRLNIKTEPDHFNYLHSGGSFIHLKNTILGMAAMLGERKIKLVINIFPVSILAVKDFRDNYPYGHLHKMIKDITDNNII